MKEDERKQLEKQFYIIGLCLFCMGVIFSLTWNILPQEFIDRFRMPCMFFKITGFYCPGCGGTRAVSALLHGKILLSVLYHPIVVYVSGIYLWYMISHTMERILGIKIAMGYRNFYLWLALALVVINIAVKDIALAAFDLDILQLLDSYS